MTSEWQQTGSHLWANGWCYINGGPPFVAHHGATSETFVALEEAKAWGDERFGVMPEWDDAVAAERERCAKMVEDEFARPDGDVFPRVVNLVARIREGQP